MKKTYSIIVIGLLGIIGFFGLVKASGQIILDPFTGQVYNACFQPFTISIQTDGELTKAVDAKMFFSGITTNTLSVSGDLYESSNNDGYTIYLDGDMDTTRFLSGDATSGGTNISGNMYYYINAINQASAGIDSGELATIYLAPNVGSGNYSYIDFYFLGSGINYDDSNISSGTKGETQYDDILNNVKNGSYFVISEDKCIYKPYIQSGTYWQRTIVPSNTGYKGVWTSVMAGPHFTDNTGTIGDDVYNKWTQSTGWTIWTNPNGGVTYPYSNTGILLQITGIAWSGTNLPAGQEGIQIIALSMFDDPNISIKGDVTSGRNQLREMYITGVFFTGGFVLFDNVIGNDGLTYQSGDNRYDDYFYINSFRVDSRSPVVYTSTQLTGKGFEDVLLSGINNTGNSNANSGRHQTFSIMDDQFIIYKFSGNNTTKYGYSNTTGYNTDLFDTYGGINYNTGFDITRTIRFTQTRSGYIYYIDRAGNTGKVFVDVDVNPKIPLIVDIRPAFRENAGNYHGRSGYATNAELWIAYQSNGSRIFSQNSYKNTGDDRIYIKNNGTGLVSIVPPNSGASFLTVLKGSGMLSIGFTGIWKHNMLDNNGNIQTGYIYFTSGAKNQPSAGTNTGSIGINPSNNIYPNVIFQNINYIKVGDIEWGLSNGNYDMIDASMDLPEINKELTIGLTYDAPGNYDFDLNDVISSIEQAIIIQYDISYGFIENYTTGANAISNLYRTGFVNF